MICTQSNHPVELGVVTTSIQSRTQTRNKHGDPSKVLGLPDPCCATGFDTGCAFSGPVAFMGKFGAVPAVKWLPDAARGHRAKSPIE
mmetsp:Transcript_97527/g.178204  ORF Transcript_97527/g.178204 Transcript_97527/m.178204 type:complete len:87 (-) Transcript_97527:1523-1783(-)